MLVELLVLVRNGLLNRDHRPHLPPPYLPGLNTDPAEAMLAAALAAERERAARRGQRDAVGGIEIKEVSAYLC